MIAFISGIGPWEVILILVIALLIFGAKKLPELGRSIGKGLKEFKKGMNDLENEASVDHDSLDDPYKKINNKTTDEKEKGKSKKV